MTSAVDSPITLPTPLVAFLLNFAHRLLTFTVFALAARLGLMLKPMSFASRLVPAAGVMAVAAALIGVIVWLTCGRSPLARVHGLRLAIAGAAFTAACVVWAILGG